MKVFAAIFIFFLLFSCQEGKAPVEKNFLVDTTLTVNQKMERIVTASYLSHLSVDSTIQKEIIAFYSARHYFPVLANDSTLTDRGLELSRSLEASIRFGIPSSRLIAISKKLHPLEKEVLLLSNFASASTDIRKGFIDFEKQKLRPKSVDKSLFSRAWYQSKSAPFDTVLLAQGPIDTNYRFLAQHFFHYCDTAYLDAKIIRVQEEKDHEKRAFDQATASLLSKRYLSEQADSLTVRSAIKQFQKDNGLRPDGQLSEATAKALTESTLEKVLRGAISLDRMRQKSDTLEKYVRINIPSFELFFFAKDSLKSHHRVIVGKVTNQTPTLSSNINRIVCFPFWKVPSSICQKEILPALKSNRNYLAKNHMKIMRGKDKEANPDKVNWKKIKANTFPYTVIQQPGIDNSLGIIKFEFPNPFSVYVHDTPSKSLFNQSYRSYSHGCMRCEHPVELAKVMLQYDSLGTKGNPLTPDSLDSLLTLKQNYPIKLMSEIPIFVEYQTVVADRTGIYFHHDLYGRETALVKILLNGK
ncbi:MAG: hypothetical protein RLZZ30_1736 [Bacteroidota bacterium]|jgi:hypothetical protein